VARDLVGDIDGPARHDIVGTEEVLPPDLAVDSVEARCRHDLRCRGLDLQCLITAAHSEIDVRRGYAYDEPND